MADEQRGEAELALQLGEQLEHARLHRDVEGARRLVGDEQLRIEGESAGERCALALAARQLVRVPVAERGGQVDGFEQLVDPCARALGDECAAVDDERLGDALGDREQRVEARRGILEDEADVGADASRGRATWLP